MWGWWPGRQESNGSEPIACCPVLPHLQRKQQSESFSLLLPAPSPCLPLPSLNHCPSLRSSPHPCLAGVGPASQWLWVYTHMSFSIPSSPSLRMCDLVPSALNLPSSCFLCPHIPFHSMVMRWPLGPASAPDQFPASCRPCSLSLRQSFKTTELTVAPRHHRLPLLFSLHSVLKESPSPSRLEINYSLCAGN